MAQNDAGVVDRVAWGWLLLAGLAACCTAAWLAYAASSQHALEVRMRKSEQDLKKMRAASQEIRGLRAVLNKRQERHGQERDDRPLVPFLEAQARKLGVTIRKVNTPAEVQHENNFVEQQVRIQLADAPLINIARFLQGIESQRPAYFVKEITNLSPNRADAESWRAEIVLARHFRKESP